MASKRNGTLYTGVTNNLGRRVHEHRKGLVPGFTEKHGIKLLVHYEQFQDIRAVIQRATSTLEPRREGRTDREGQPELEDLYPTLTW